MGSWFSDLVNPTKENLDAIYQYVESQRPHIPQYPNLETQIVNFEKWYQGLGPSDWLMDQETLNEAKRRRNLVNDAMGQKPDPSVIPADAPYTPPDPSSSAKSAKTLLDYAPSILIGSAIVAGVAVVGTAAYRASTFIPKHEK